MELGLKAKRALVIGSSKGLGNGIAAELHREGARVFLCGRDRDTLERSVQALAATSPDRVASATVDLTDKASLTALVRSVKDEWGGIDILVNNCGGPPPGPISAVDSDQWQFYFNAMANSIFYLTSEFLPGMREQGWGRILNITSSGVVQPIPVLGISNTVRSSIVGWAKTLSLEVARDGVTINTILPGRIKTERLQQLDRANAERLHKSVEEVAAAAKGLIPLGRYGEVEEFAQVAVFLLSECASYLTGSMIRVDGGAIQSV